MSQAHARALVTQPEATTKHLPVQPVTNEDQTRRTLDPAVLISIVAFVVLAMALAHVAQRAEVAVLNYELQREHLRLAQAERVRNHLLVEVAKNRSLADVEAEARGRLGMVDPDDVRWLTVASGTTSSATMEDLSEPHAAAPLVSAVSTWYERVRHELGGSQ